MIDDILALSVRSASAVTHRMQAQFVRYVLRRRGLGSCDRIHSFTTREELAQLFMLARRCPMNARALEIGSYLGASTCYIAAGLRGTGASVTCVDTWHNETMPGGIRDTFAEFMNNVRPVATHVQVVRKRSGDVTRHDLHGPFDLVFIDGDHSYLAARADFELVSTLVADEGVVVFHDSRYYEGVSRVIGEALASSEWQLGGNLLNMSWILRAQFSHGSGIVGDSQAQDCAVAAGE